MYEADFPSVLAQSHDIQQEPVISRTDGNLQRDRNLPDREIGIQLLFECAVKITEQARSDIQFRYVPASYTDAPAHISPESYDLVVVFRNEREPIAVTEADSRIV